MSTPSPCIRVCFLDEVKRICIGCGRTLDEISRWSRLDDKQQKAVAAKLPARLEGLRLMPEKQTIPQISLAASTA